MATSLVKQYRPLLSALPLGLVSAISLYHRPSSSSSTPSKPSTSSRKEPRYNFTPSSFSQDPSDEDPDHHSYPLVTAQSLLTRRNPPKRVKMLVRDYIDDCLYNPHYGYFATKVEIFDPDLAKGKAVEGRGFEFAQLKNMRAFEDEVARRYGVFEGQSVGKGGPGRQVWHTPTELFKPWYGRSIARFLLSEYKLHNYPYNDLIIYEIGAGNGTLMRDILDYIRDYEPAVYERTKYRIVEISERLQGVQKKSVRGGDGGAREKARGHRDKVEVLNSSIFDWDRVVHEPCFFLALEVLDNFAHDVVRYTLDTHEPLQCTISISSTGDYTELYSPVSDPLISRYLSLIPPTLPRLPKFLSALPFAPNLGQHIWIPTKQLILLDKLRDKFPNHRLLMSDFSELPDTIGGRGGPVVQTRYEGETIACSTYLVQPGFFDIFFPTDFAALRRLYSLVMSPSPIPSLSASSQTFFSPSRNDGSGKPIRQLRVWDHGEFLERWGEVEVTRLQDGSSPLLEVYQNAKFIC